MFHLIVLLIKSLFLCFSGKNRDVVIENLILKKEIMILKRKSKKRIKFKFTDRLFFAVLNKRSNKVKKCITLIRPETVLKWQSDLIKKFWTFRLKKARIGRPSVKGWIKNLILKIKNENLFWGCKRIQGELLKLGIELHKKTISNILRDFRRKGKIRKGLTWSKFLKSQIKSIYAMDFFTADTIFNVRFYVFFLIRHKTREIIQYAITANPTKEFVRQQIIDLKEDLNVIIYLIHDRTGEFMLNYIDYGIQGVKISVKAPNMNAVCERWIGSARREILDHFIIFGKNQLRNILKEYIEYYNKIRPHQGIKQQIPKGYIIRTNGKVKSRSILFGLNQEFFREAA